MIKAVIIGFAHMHVNEVALYISEQPDTELAAIADVKMSAVSEKGAKQTNSYEEIPPYRYTQGWNQENVRQNYCSNWYDDYKEMLDKEKPDFAYILCENCMKAEVVEECAKRGISVSIEKPIADNLAQAKKIQSIVKQYGVEAVVNWPVFWRPYIHRMKQALDAGMVGTPLKLRYINGHTGPLGKGAKHRGVSAQAEEMSDELRAKTWWHNLQCGGGVFLDICCYGCLFSRWFMGEGAESVFAYGANLNTPYGDTDDNFAAIIKYPACMSVVEGTWTTPRAVIPSGPMVMCSDGVICCTGGAEAQPDVKAYDMYGEEMAVPEIELGEEYKNMPWMYAHHVKTGVAMPEMLDLDHNIEIMAILDAAIRSAENRKEEKIDDSWNCC